jgi:prevent-host-death family protein
MEGNSMEITTKQLQIRTGKIISHVNNGQEITITYRGKAYARIVPIKLENFQQEELDNELFGIWKDREDIGDDVDQYVRSIRGSINLC